METNQNKKTVFSSGAEKGKRSRFALKGMVQTHKLGVAYLKYCLTSPDSKLKVLNWIFLAVASYHFAMTFSELNDSNLLNYRWQWIVWMLSMILGNCVFESVEENIATGEEIKLDVNSISFAGKAGILFLFSEFCFLYPFEYNFETDITQGSLLGLGMILVSFPLISFISFVWLAVLKMFLSGAGRIFGTFFGSSDVESEKNKNNEKEK